MVSIVFPSFYGLSDAFQQSLPMGLTLHMPYLGRFSKTSLDDRYKDLPVLAMVWGMWSMMTYALFVNQISKSK